MRQLTVVAIIGIIFIGGYFVAIPEYTVRSVIFQCEEMGWYWNNFHLNLQLLNNGFFDTVLADSQIKIYFRTPEDGQILIGSKSYPSIIQLERGKVIDLDLYVDSDIHELSSFVESRGLFSNTESGQKFYQDSSIIVEMVCTTRSLLGSTQVKYSYSMSYFDIKR